ncbi:AbgT family transporter [Mycoplasmatota bacterium WC44]
MKKQKWNDFFSRSLNKIEKVGNKLPHPVMIFLILTVVVLFVSAIGEALGWQVTYEDAKYGKEVTASVVNFLSGTGIATILSNAVSWFTSFAPLGVVLVAMLGVGLAEKAGLLGSLIERSVSKAPKSIISYVVVFIGIMSNIAADAGYVVLIPLGAAIFIGFKRHPLAGMAAAFAGVSGGFSANLLFGSLDALLAGITNEAMGYEAVGLLSNWFFMLASTFLITIVGGLITDKIVEPRLGVWKGTVKATEKVEDALVDKGMKAALVAFVVFMAVVIWLVLPLNFFGAGSLLLAQNELGSLSYLDRLLGFTAPFYRSLIVLITLGFAIPGIAYGYATGTIKNTNDIVKKMTASMESLGGYIVLSFFAAIFIKVFSLSNLGVLIAVKGANLLESLGLDGMPLLLLIAFIIVSALINLFIGSSSAKWGIMAPVFAVMLNKVGISPEWTQLAYRIGDSSTNIISPLMAYFAIIVVFASMYDVEGEEPTGIGTILSMMIPYSIIFLFVWIILMVVWYGIGLPIGITPVV